MFVHYKCRCMRDEIIVFVADRKDDEDVLHWVETVLGRAIGTDHSSRSPLCSSKTMEYVKIPVDQDGNARIGKMRRT